jgi:hypothetical protein
MGFFSKLLKLGADQPGEPLINDPVLGEMKWSDRSEGWEGSYNGFNFMIGLGRSTATVPDPSVVAYAREVLADPNWLRARIAEGSEAFKKYIGKQWPYYQKETNELKLNTVCFWKNQYIYLDFEGGDSRRCWDLDISHGKPGRLKFHL